MSYSLSAPLESRSFVDRLLCGLGVKVERELSSQEMEEHLLRESAWQMNVDLVRKIRGNRKDCNYGGENEVLIASLLWLSSRAESYRKRRTNLRGWVRQRLESELLFTLQALISIDQIGYENMDYSMKKSWESLIDESLWKMGCWLGEHWWPGDRKRRMDRGFFLLPGKLEGGAPLAFMPELLRKPIKPVVSPPQPKLEVLDEVLADWRRTVEAWEAGKSGVRVSSLRTRGNHLVRQVNSSIEVMAASPKLQSSQRARDRLQASMTSIQAILLEALKRTQEENESTFIADLDILDRQVPR